MFHLQESTMIHSSTLMANREKKCKKYRSMRSSEDMNALYCTSVLFFKKKEKPPIDH